MSGLVIDLFTRKILTHVPETVPTARREPEDETWTFDKLKALIRRRYQDDTPKHFEAAWSSGIKASEPYAFGDVHNVVYRSESKVPFNQPMPCPMHVKRLTGVLGSECIKGLSDPFPWMDRKYLVGLEALRAYREAGKPLEIFTRSDLIATQDYLDEIPDGTVVNIVCLGQPFDEHICQLIEPGAPSLKRRAAAVTALRQAGVNARLYRVRLVNPRHQAYLDIVNGTGPFNAELKISCKAVVKMRRETGELHQYRKGVI